MCRVQVTAEQYASLTGVIRLSLGAWNIWKHIRTQGLTGWEGLEAEGV